MRRVGVEIEPVALCVGGDLLPPPVKSLLRRVQPAIDFGPISGGDLGPDLSPIGGLGVVIAADIDERAAVLLSQPVLEPSRGLRIGRRKIVGCEDDRVGRFHQVGSEIPARAHFVSRLGEHLSQDGVAVDARLEFGFAPLAVLGFQIVLWSVPAAADDATERDDDRQTGPRAQRPARRAEAPASRGRSGSTPIDDGVVGGAGHVVACSTSRLKRST